MEQARRPLHFVQRHRTGPVQKRFRVAAGSIQNVRVVEGAVAPPFRLESLREDGLAGLARACEHDGRHDGKAVLERFRHETRKWGFDHMVNDIHSCLD